MKIRRGEIWSQGLADEKFSSTTLVRLPSLKMNKSVTFSFCICWQQSEFVVVCIRLCIFVLCRKQSGNMDVCIPIGIFIFGGNSRWIVGGGTLPVLQWGRGGLQVRSGSSLPSKFSWNNLKSDDTVLQKYNNVLTWYWLLKGSGAGERPYIKWGQTTEWCPANSVG